MAIYHGYEIDKNYTKSNLAPLDMQVQQANKISEKILNSRTNLFLNDAIFPIPVDPAKI